MIDPNTVSRTNRCMYPNYSPRQPKPNNPLVGSWSVTETLIDGEGESSISTETFAFYRNSSLKWVEKIDGKTLFIERGSYTISRDRLFVNYPHKNISEEAIFFIIDNKVSLRFDLWGDPVILTKQ